MKNMVVLLLICISIPAFAVEPTGGMVGKPNQHWCDTCNAWISDTTVDSSFVKTAVDSTTDIENSANTTR